MSNYTKTTNFASKDNLSPGNPLKIVKGTEIDTEFNNIQTAVATKTDNSAANITGGSITGITDLAVADGGTGASTATAALNNLLPTQTGNANKYLQTDGTNATWDAVTLSTADITGTLPVANGGTGVTSSTGTGSVVLSNSPTLVTPALGTPASGTATNLTGLPISTGVSGLGTGVATFLGTPSSANLASAVTDETGSGALVFANSPTLVTPALGTPSSGTLTNATGLPISTGVSGLGTGVATFLATPSSANLASAVSDETGSGALVFANSPTLVTPALGTPSALVGTNITGTASGLTAGNVTTNANLTGAVTSVGNATSLGSFSSANLLGALTDETGTGSAVFATSPTLVTPILGTPTSATLTNATGLPIATGVSGLGTGVATALAVNVGSSGAPLVNGGVLGTPSSGTATNLTGLPLTTGVTGTLPTANGGTGLTSFTSGGVVYASSTSALATGSALTFDGTNLSVTSPSTATTFTLADNAGRNVVLKNSLGTGGAAEVGTTTNHDFYVRAGAGAAGLNSLYLQAGGVTGYSLSYAGLHTWFVGATRTMDLTSTGLGIGTSSPGSYKLKAVGTGGNLSGNAYFVGLFGEGAASNKGVGLGYDSSSQTGIVFGETASAASNLAFWTYSGSAWGERMRLDSAGNVGIGTSSPVAKLEVAFNQNLSTLGQSRRLILNDLRGGANERTEIGFGYVGTTQPAVIGYQTTSTDSNTKGILYFATRDVTTATEPTERARFPTAGGFQVAGSISVGNATPTTSGYGITFPASQSASSDANTLDDYEEGTWTPAFAFSTSGSVTYTIQEGYYRKVGSLVFVECNIIIASVSSPTGTVTVNNLPYTTSSSAENVASLAIGIVRNLVNAKPNIKAACSRNSTTILFSVNDTISGASELQGSDLQASTLIYVSGCFIAA